MNILRTTSFSLRFRRMPVCLTCCSTREKTRWQQFAADGARRSLRRKWRCNRTQPRVPVPAAGLLFGCDQPVRIHAAAVPEGCLGFLETDMGKGREVRGHVIGCEKVLGAAKLVGLADAELKCMVTERCPLAEAVVAGRPQNHESPSAGNKNSADFRNGLLHFLSRTVIEDSET